MQDIKQKLNQIINTTFNNINTENNLSPRNRNKVLSIDLDNYKSNKTKISEFSSYSTQASTNSPRKQITIKGNDFIRSPTKNKLLKEIQQINVLLNKSISKGGYINRPAVNINKRELDVSSRNYLAYSPTCRKSRLTTSKWVKEDYDRKKICFFKKETVNNWSIIDNDLTLFEKDIKFKSDVNKKYFKKNY